MGLLLSWPARLVQTFKHFPFVLLNLFDDIRVFGVKRTVALDVLHQAFVIEALEVLAFLRDDALNHLFEGSDFNAEVFTVLSQKALFALLVDIAQGRL